MGDVAERGGATARHRLHHLENEIADIDEFDTIRVHPRGTVADRRPTPDHAKMDEKI